MLNLYKLSEALRTFRQKAGKSIQEVADEAQVSRSYMSKLENAHERPSREFFEKIYSIYALSKSDFQQLLNLAGYPNMVHDTQRKEEMQNMGNNIPSENSQQGVQVEVPPSMDVLYSDVVIITSSPYGVILTFAQSGTAPSNFKAVARIGMSKVHGKALVNELKNNLEKSEKVITPLNKQGD